MCTLLRKHACVSALLLFRKVLVSPPQASSFPRAASPWWCLHITHKSVRRTHVYLTPPDPPPIQSGGCVCLQMDTTWSV